MNTAGYDSKMAALYYPWIEVMDPLTRRPITIPPSGHIAGVWARIDQQRGVHKAPANEVVMGANGLEFQVTHDEQGVLNPIGINCIRAFPAAGFGSGARARSRVIRSGATSTSAACSTSSRSRSSPGTQWAVFEPNDLAPGTSLTIRRLNFLRGLWRSGALFGAVAAEAFYVKCDAETNPPEVDRGRARLSSRSVSPRSSRPSSSCSASASSPAAAPRRRPKAPSNHN